MRIILGWVGVVFVSAPLFAGDQYISRTLYRDFTCDELREDFEGYMAEHSELFDEFMDNFEGRRRVLEARSIFVEERLSIVDGHLDAIKVVAARKGCDLGPSHANPK